MFLPESTFQNAAVEKAVLGCMILNKDALLESLASINDVDFYDPTNKEMFLGIKKIYEKNQIIEPLTICNVTNIDIAYVAEITGGITFTDSYDSHIEIIKECSIKRQILGRLNKINTLLKDDIESNHTDIYLKTLSLMDIDIKSKEQDITFMSTGMQLLDQLENQTENNKKYGFPWLDNITKGIFDSDLIYIGARPGVGKTAFSLNIAANLAFKGNKIALFNMEMTKIQLLMRLISSMEKINHDNLKEKKVTQEEYTKVFDCINTISKLNMKVYDSTPTIEEIKIEAKKLKNKGDLDAIVIDYVQIVRTKERYTDNVQRIEYISRELKGMAKDLNIPVICLSQVNRDSAGTVPQLHHMKGAGAIEQDADVVLFLHNPRELEKKDTGPIDIHLIIAKQRSGEADLTNKNFKFYGSVQRFVEIDRRFT
jgi:replicative DNA helicase